MTEPTVYTRCESTRNPSALERLYPRVTGTPPIPAGVRVLKQDYTL
jgi:hypothetical protein